MVDFGAFRQAASHPAPPAEEAGTQTQMQKMNAPPSPAAPSHYASPSQALDVHTLYRDLCDNFGQFGFFFKGGAGAFAADVVRHMELGGGGPRR